MRIQVCIYIKYCFQVRRLEEQLSTSVRETATCHDALRDYQLQLDERANAERVMKRQLAEAIEELRETKEALQFAEDELRSMATTESVSSSGMDPQPPQQQKQLSSREKSPEQNSERTPPDGRLASIRNTCWFYIALGTENKSIRPINAIFRP